MGSDVATVALGDAGARATGAATGGADGRGRMQR
jgi:hypothetical protein